MFEMNTVLVKRFSNDFHKHIIVSDGVNIKAIYKSIARNENNDMKPLFSDFPKIKPEKIYGLQIDPSGYMCIVSGAYVLESIMYGEWEEVR